MNEEMINAIVEAWVNAAEDLGEFFEREDQKDQYRQLIKNQYPPQKINQFYAIHGRLPESRIETGYAFFYE